MRLPEDQCHRIFAGEAPLKVWREFRGLEVTDLRTTTKIPVTRIDQIERGKGRPINREEAKIFAKALDITSDNLMPHALAYRGCSALEVDEDAILARSDDDEPARA